MAQKLQPRSVTIQSEVKFFRLGDAGSSDGTSMGMTFDIPEGMTTREVRIEMLKEKRALDLMVLNAERLKGTIDDRRYDLRKSTIMRSYEAALKGTESEQQTDT